jgi:hypothetical protein
MVHLKRPNGPADAPREDLVTLSVPKAAMAQLALFCPPGVGPGEVARQTIETVAALGRPLNDAIMELDHLRRLVGALRQQRDRALDAAADGQASIDRMGGMLQLAQAEINRLQAEPVADDPRSPTAGAVKEAQPTAAAD